MQKGRSGVTGSRSGAGPWSSVTTQCGSFFPLWCLHVGVASSGVHLRWLLAVFHLRREAYLSISRFKENGADLHLLLETVSFQVGESVKRQARPPWPSLMTLRPRALGISSDWSFTKPHLFSPTFPVSGCSLSG